MSGNKSIVDEASALMLRSEAFAAITITETFYGPETVQSIGYDVDFTGVKDAFGVTESNEDKLSLAVVANSLCQALDGVASELGAPVQYLMSTYQQAKKAADAAAGDNQ